MAVKCFVKAHKASALKICMRWVIKLLYSLRTPADTITANAQQKAFTAPPVSLSSFFSRSQFAIIISFHFTLKGEKITPKSWSINIFPFVNIKRWRLRRDVVDRVAMKPDPGVSDGGVRSRVSSGP